MEETAQAAQPPAKNPFWLTLRQPRVLLILLALWAIVGALTEFFTSSSLFVDLPAELDGALGGRALSWEAIPLAVLYLYCSRDPVRYQRVFWLALIEQAAAIFANIYHLGAGDFSLESVFIPIAVAGGLALLVFLHLFQPKGPEAASEPL
ncbi:MAG: hypothetical protein IIC87_03880 [Chloroflexi bacterium]|nr:hypothetical protein [Chloroflexota bacterium]